MLRHLHRDDDNNATIDGTNIFVVHEITLEDIMRQMGFIGSRKKLLTPHRLTACAHRFALYFHGNNNHRRNALPKLFSLHLLGLFVFVRTGSRTI